MLAAVPTRPFGKFRGSGLERELDETALVQSAACTIGDLLEDALLLRQRLLEPGKDEVGDLVGRALLRRLARCTYQCFVI